MWLRTIGLIVTLVLGLLAAPLLVEAQQAGKVYRIGYMGFRAGPNANDEVFFQALRALGWIEGQNIAIEYRWGAGKRESYPALAEELVRLKVDLIVVNTNSVTLAAKNATSTIPIVMLQAADAVETGLVASLARPGGNVTGSTMRNTEVNTKLLELLHETLPQVTRVAWLWNPTAASYVRAFKAAQLMAPELGLTLQSLPLRNAEEIESVLEAAAQERAGALLVMGAMYRVFGPRIAAFAAKNRVPIFSVATGSVEKYFGLLGYAPLWSVLFRDAATYVDEILKGAKPADLPVQQAVKYNLVVNLKTAKALGVTIPPTILFQATKVIK